MADNVSNPVDGGLTSTRPSRRSVLVGAGKACTAGVLAAGLGGMLPASARAGVYIPEGMRCMTILYPNQEDAEFDFAYYRDTHMKLIQSRYGDSIKRMETRRPVSGTEQDSPYLAVTNIWIRDMKAFSAAAEKHRAELMKDIPNFTNVQGVVQQAEVFATYGMPAFQIGMGDRCLTAVYPKDAGSRLDLQYYRDSHLAMLYRLFGFEAIKRYEIRIPAEDAGADAPFYAGTNIYVANQAAFDRARERHIDQILADIPNFTDITPRTMMTEVQAIVTP